MFIDSARVTVKAGDGGRGAASFRREKYVPLGGPDGGDGGRGGSVIFKASQHENTLFKFRHVKKFVAEKGRSGQKRNQAGRSGESLIIPVPCGTIVFNADTGEVIFDLKEHGQERVLLTGGRGGRGNCRFKTHMRKAPSFAELGEPGKELNLRLELKLLADVGLVGFPNAGKSTFLSAVSNARPKIADYPFTTLEPVLGTVALDMTSTMVVSDLPGLIEGAAKGLGLGHRFLKHVERTGVILHLIDINTVQLEDIQKSYNAIRKELQEYSDILSRKKEIIVFTKTDLFSGGSQALDNLKQEIGDLFKDLEIHFISSLADQGGIKELLWSTFNKVREFRNEEVLQEAQEVSLRKYTARAPYNIEKVEDYYVVTGENISRIVKMTDLDNSEAVSRLDRILNKMGIIKTLRKLGAIEGDHIVIDDFEFIWNENVEFTPARKRRKNR
jgi:GTP-binding protein